jgi:hypothetical protein
MSLCSVLSVIMLSVIIPIVIIPSVIILSVIMLSAECHYANCHYAECHCAECSGTNKLTHLLEFERKKGFRVEEENVCGQCYYKTFFSLSPYRSAHLPPAWADFFGFLEFNWDRYRKYMALFWALLIMTLLMLTLLIMTSLTMTFTYNDIT